MHLGGSMLLKIYLNGAIKVEDDSKVPDDSTKTLKESEIVVQHDDTLTKGQMVSKQRQHRVIHTFGYVGETCGFIIYGEVE